MHWFWKRLVRIALFLVVAFGSVVVIIFASDMLLSTVLYGTAEDNKLRGSLLTVIATLWATFIIWYLLIKRDWGSFDDEAPPPK